MLFSALGLWYFQQNLKHLEQLIQQLADQFIYPYAEPTQINIWQTGEEKGLGFLDNVSFDVNNTFVGDYQPVVLEN